MSRMLVCGDRRWLKRFLPDGKPDRLMNLRVLYKTWDALTAFAKEKGVTVLIEGCADGGDEAAEGWSRLPRSPIKEHLHYPADWEQYGRPAGILRNIQMLNDGMPDYVVAFHDDLEHSKGTGHMVAIAQQKGIPVFHFTTEDILNANH